MPSVTIAEFSFRQTPPIEYSILHARHHTNYIEPSALPGPDYHCNHISIALRGCHCGSTACIHGRTLVMGQHIHESTTEAGDVAARSELAARFGEDMPRSESRPVSISSSWGAAEDARSETGAAVGASLSAVAVLDVMASAASEQDAAASEAVAMLGSSQPPLEIHSSFLAAALDRLALCLAFLVFFPNGEAGLAFSSSSCIPAKKKSLRMQPRRKYEAIRRAQP